MHLTYQGGVSLPLRPEASRHTLQLDGVPMVLLPLGMEEEAYEVTLCQGETVSAGGPVAVLGDGTPVYSSISGVVTGVFEKDGISSSQILLILSSSFESAFFCSSAFFISH